MGKLDIKPDFFICSCAACLLLPLKLTMAWFLAALVHELGHYLAIRFTGTQLYRISIGAFGAVMETEPMTGRNELLCALAGPCSGLLLLFVVKWFPLLAICGFVQSIYNLLPLFPLDGGRALKCFLKKLFTGNTSSILYRIVEITVLTLLGIGALYLTFRLLLGPLPILAVLILIWKTKLSCKQTGQRVQ